MKHVDFIEGYDFETLAQKIGDLRYDALADFLEKLAQKIAQDGQKDASRNRNKLANELAQTAQHLQNASEHINQAWKICKPFMKD